MDNFFDVAVVGAQTAVGKQILRLIEGVLPKKTVLFFYADRQTTKNWQILPLNNENIIKNRVDIAFFCAPAAVSKRFSPLFSALSTTVIDLSSAFRLEEGVPLVVPSVNPFDTYLSTGIIANPNAATASVAAILAPLHKKYGIKRVIFHGAIAQVHAPKDGCTTANQALMHKDGCTAANQAHAPKDGCTALEQAMIDETKKVLAEPTLPITASFLPFNTPCASKHTVKAPNLRCKPPLAHGSTIAPSATNNAVLAQATPLNDTLNNASENIRSITHKSICRIGINLRLGYSCTPADIKQTLADVCTFLDTHAYAIDSSHLSVERLRRDPSNPDTFNLCIAFNPTKRAAQNAVETALLLKN